MDDRIPCPFCGSHKVAVGAGDYGEFMFCEDCDARGPLTQSIDDALAAWNMRTRPDEGKMTTADLQTLLSQPPANFVWSKSNDGSRTIGTCPGCAVDLWPDRVEAVAVFASDDPALAARNATLFTLILAALRPDWVTAPDWLTMQMRMATKAKGPYEGANYSRQVTFTFDRRESRATLKVRR